MTAVCIDRKVLEQMIQHARHTYPLECCGLLSGLGEAIDRGAVRGQHNDAEHRCLRLRTVDCEVSHAAADAGRGQARPGAAWPLLSRVRYAVQGCRYNGNRRS